MRVIDAHGRDTKTAEVQHQMLPALLLRLFQTQLSVGDLLATCLMGLRGLVDVVGCGDGSDAGEACRQHLLISCFAQSGDSLFSVAVTIALVAATATVVGAAGASVVVGVTMFARPAAWLIDRLFETAAAGPLAGRWWSGPVWLQVVRRRGARVRIAVLGGCTTSPASLCNHGLGWVAEDPFRAFGEVFTVAVGACHHREIMCSVASLFPWRQCLRGAVVADMLVPELESYDMKDKQEEEAKFQVERMRREENRREEDREEGPQYTRHQTAVQPTRQEVNL